MCDTLLQHGHTKPSMLTTNPNTGSFAFKQNVSSRRTSLTLTSCGVVTTMAQVRGTTPPPSTFEPLLSCNFCTFVNNDASVMCSSVVPGGVSISKQSSARSFPCELCQFTSRRNCLSAPFFC